MTRARLRRLGGIACVLAAWASAGAPASAQFGVFRRGKSPNYQAFRDPGGRFVIEYPVKDWRVVPSGGSVLASFGQKNADAAVIIDYTKLKIALTAQEIDEVVVRLEVAVVKERNPAVTDVKSTIVATPAGPRIVLEYVRTGAGGAENVVQYSIPAGDDLYRVICTARAAQRQKYQATLSYIAESFSVLRLRN